ncbi:MAG: Xaa-Pro peptidase family protein [Rhodopila sp.]|nr:Xaa-Pro peptidase family protein [Rhodopila sp.]
MGGTIIPLRNRDEGGVLLMVNSANDMGAARVARLRRMMDEHDLDALICFKPENSFYLTGFNPIIYSHPVIAILPREGEPVMLCHALRDDHARASTWVKEIRLYGTWSTKVTMGPNWLEALGVILRERGLEAGRLGVEEDFLPVRRMAEVRSVAPTARFADASDILFEARLIKDAGEIAMARIAADLADTGMAAAIDVLGQGGSERHVSVAAMAAMNRHWLDAYPDVEVCDFGTLEGGAQNGLWAWCLTGERVLINCDNPTLRRPAAGEIAMVMIWTNANGMHAENERSVAIGPLPDERKRAYEAILGIREEVKPLLKTGVPVAEVFAKARDGYEKRGYLRNLPGRIGHGIGLGAHEHLSLDGRSKTVLAAGMMLSFEPNLRLPEWGGLQHSDTVVITAGEPEFLTRSPNGYLQVDV